MMNHSVLNIPTDYSTKKVEVEQQKLYQHVESNQKECLELKSLLKRVLTTAVSNKKKLSEGSSSTTSSSTYYKSVKSVDSIKEIASDGTITEDIHMQSLLNEFTSMSENAELDISDEIIKELYNVNTRVDACVDVSSKLQKTWCELDSSITQIKSDIANIKQYFKVDNLLLHGFRYPSQNLSSLQFSMYVADLINYVLPFLPVPVSWQHISTAHPLPTRAKKSTVVVIRFSNRHIKDMIYDHRHLINNGMLITEHLTDENKAVHKKAKELFGVNYVDTVNCKTVVYLDGKSIPVMSIDDVEKLFAKYCESIGSNDKYTFINHQPASSSNVASYYSNNYAAAVQSNRNATNRNNATSYSRRVNVNNRNVYNRQNSFQPKQRRRFSGKPSTGYSVHNRHY